MDFHKPCGSTVDLPVEFQGGSCLRLDIIRLPEFYALSRSAEVHGRTGVEGEIPPQAMTPFLRIILTVAIPFLAPVLSAYGQERTLPFAGEMRYMADAALFTDCQTGRSYPIAMEADYVRMERAYLDVAGEPGGPLYVTFEGFIAPRPKMEGDGLEPTVVVEHFINVWPGRKCERDAAK